MIGCIGHDGDCCRDRERIEKDAARYRWLRDSNRIPPDAPADCHILVCAASGEDVLWGSEMDRAVDSAMPPNAAGNAP